MKSAKTWEVFSICHHMRKNLPIDSYIALKSEQLLGNIDWLFKTAAISFSVSVSFVPEQ